MTDPSPRAPAAAYTELAAMVGDSYFTERVPLVGTALVVEGLDGNQVEWIFTDAHGLLMADKVRSHIHLRLVRSYRFAKVEPV